MSRPAAIGVVLVLFGLLGLASWWKVAPRIALSCPDGGAVMLDDSGTVHCGAGTELPPGQALTVRQKFDCNTATAEDFALVSGVGASVAAELVRARPDGGYRSWEELDAVEGVGPARLIALQAVCEFRLADSGVW